MMLEGVILTLINKFKIRLLLNINLKRKMRMIKSKILNNNLIKKDNKIPDFKAKIAVIVITSSNSSLKLIINNIIKIIIPTIQTPKKLFMFKKSSPKMKMLKKNYINQKIRVKEKILIKINLTQISKFMLETRIILDTENMLIKITTIINNNMIKEEIVTKAIIITNNKGI